MKISFSDLARAMDSSDKSLRMKAAMTAGTYPDPDFIELLISQCASEVDFFVRDTLSWALIRQDRDVVFQRLKHELYSVNPQSVSQALHTFTKLDDASAWTLITREFLLNEDERIAQTAWRAASRFVPVNAKLDLLQVLVTQLGRGDFEMQLNLSNAICALELEEMPVIEEALKSESVAIRQHAEFSLRLARNPDAGRALSVEYAKRVEVQKGEM